MPYGSGGSAVPTDVAADAINGETAETARGDVSGRDSAVLLAHIEQLIHLLESADTAFRAGSTGEDREQVLSDALTTIGELYGILEVGRSPVASAHLEAVFDTCLRALGDAYGGDVEALSAAVTLVRAIRTALRPTISGKGVTGIRRAA